MVKDGNQKAGSKPPPESKFRAFCKRHKGWIIYGIALLIWWLILEFIRFRFHKELWPIIPKTGGLILSGGGIFLAAVVDYLTDKADKKRFHRPQNMDFWSHVAQLGGTLRRNVLQNTLVGIIIAVTIFVSAPAYAVHQGYFPTMLRGIAAAWHLVWTPPPENAGSSQEQTEEPAPNVSQPEPEADTKIQPPPKKTEKSPKTSEPDTKEEGKLFNPKELELDGEVPESVSSEDYQLIYLLAEPYLITDWDSQDVVNETVRNLIRDQRQHKLPPRFQENERTPEANQRIAEASELEKSMKTAWELRGVIDMREYVYLGDPGDPENPETPEFEAEEVYSVAKLVREDYCIYGDAYALQNVSRAYARTFYEWSIRWGFRTLEYDVTTVTLHSNLMILVERYDKIVLVTDQESVEHIYASKLSEAFQTAADEVAAGADWLYS